MKLLQGDYKKVLDGYIADLILTSPPYNIGSQAPAKTGRRKFGLYDVKNFRSICEYPDNLPEDKYQDTQIDFLNWAADHLSSNGVLVYNHKPRRKGGRLIHPITWTQHCGGLDLVEEIIWDRGSTHNHCPQMMYQQTERLYVFRKKGGKYLLRNDKAANLPFNADVWRIPRSTTNGHNAPFPLSLAEGVIFAWCPKDGIVMDPFCGSGTTAIAAYNCGREFVGAELLPKYHKLALQRIKVETQAVKAC